MPESEPNREVTDARVTELELRFMDQQAELEQMSQVLYAQQRTIDTLVKRLEHLEKKLAAEPGLVDAAANEKPPHY